MPIASATLADIPKPISQLAKRRLIVGWSVDVHISHSPETSSRDETMANSNIASRPLRMGERVCSVPCVDGAELARAFFTFAALVGAAMCSAC
jgi:hypothetical protein